jgi:hypothetical protein
MKVLHLAAALALGVATPSVVLAQCPPVGDATAGCDLVITVTDSGTTIAAGPSAGIAGGTYDGSDDTLIGILNNSSTALSSINLSSTTDIFGFDGDGIDTFGVTGNTSDSSGYGGPDSFFTGINGAATSGTVDFVTALAANGGAPTSLWKKRSLPPRSPSERHLSRTLSCCSVRAPSDWLALCVAVSSTSKQVTAKSRSDITGQR